jgi:hypothetical protein
VEALVARLRKQSEADKVRFLIAEALSTGRLSHADVREMTDADWVNPSLLGELDSIFSGIDLQDIDDEEISRLLSTKPGPEHCVYLDAPVGDRHVVVNTILEYEAAIADGMYARSRGAEAVAFLWFERPRQILNILRTAQFADESHIRLPRHGVCDIALLPATLLFRGVYESDEAFETDEAFLAGKTIQDLVRASDASIQQVDAYSVTIVWGGRLTFLMELMRADVDGDGVEDLVITWAGMILGASFNEAAVLCLRRLSGQGLFEVGQLP